jgi:peptidoglycan/LPS O-acetylase OafA/YrhL
MRPIPGIFFLYGQQAVSFFFILSGLVLTYSYCEAVNAGSLGWSGFMNLRLARIVPLHVATWLIATVLYVFFSWRTTQGEHPLASWTSGLLCLQVYWPTADNLFRWNGQAWSISCEMFFYAMFPLFLPLLARRLKSAGSLAVAMAGVLAAQAALYFCAAGAFAHYDKLKHPFLAGDAYVHRLRDVVLVFPPLRLGEFVLGMCLGLLILRRGAVLKSARSANLALGFCCVAMIAIMKLVPWDRLGPVMSGTQEYLAFVPVLALLLLALASGRTVITPLLENRFAILLGDASYSLYLVHGFLEPGSYQRILRGAVSVGGVVARPADYVLCVIGSILCSIVFYLLLEKPARRAWRRATKASRVEPTTGLVADSTLM